MALDRLDAQDQLVGDLAVGRRRGERALERRAAERVQHAALGGESSGGVPERVVTVVRVSLGPGDEHEQRASRPRSRRRRRAAGGRGCACRSRTSRCVDRPSSEIVHAVPSRSSTACARETSVSQGSGTSLRSSRPMLSTRGVELDDLLAPLVVEVEQERRAAALGGEALGSSTGETWRSGAAAFTFMLLVRATAAPCGSVDRGSRTGRRAAAAGRAASRPARTRPARLSGADRCPRCVGAADADHDVRTLVPGEPQHGERRSRAARRRHARRGFPPMPA